jgi:beta-lactamase regulating signal transducer with metallopeptidase domain
VNSPSLIALANHLWQSTLFALAMGSLTLLFRKNSARVRYLLWLTASAKFLVPFTLLTALGARIPWGPRPVHGIEPSFLSIAGQVAGPISPFGRSGARVMAEVTRSASGGEVVLIAIGVLWGVGTLAVAARWFTRWLLVRRALRESTQMSLAFVIPVRSSASQLEPAVVGVLRPVLLVPKGMEQRLAPEEMGAVLAHERCHVAWRDNLAAALHMLVETLFWFHPLIWWLGTRLLDERERACDEQVLAGGHSPESYAEGILKVCEHYLAPHLACVAAVSGANLKLRIRGILQNRLVERLNGARRLVLAVTVGATIAVPVAVGAFDSPHAGAEAQTPASDGSAFRRVSIHLAPTNPKNTSGFWFELDGVGF